MAPRSCLGDLARGFGQFAVPVVVGRFFRAKALRFGANGDGARGCRNPLRGTVVGTFSALGLRVKTLDRSSRLRWRGASSPSWGCRHGASVLLDLTLGVLGGKSGFRLFFVVFLSLSCCVKGFSHHLVSVRPLDFIYKVGRKPMSRNLNNFYLLEI